MRVDEGGRKHEARPVDDAVRVPLERRADRGDDTVVDAHVDGCVDTFDWIEDARARDDERVPRRGLRVEHHATPSGVVFAADSTSTGPCVSRS